MRVSPRWFLASSAVAVVVVIALLVTPAFASFTWQGRIGQRSWSLTNPGNDIYEITVTWTNANTDIDILVCTSSNLNTCQNDGDRVWARGFGTQSRVEQVVFGNFGGGTIYFHAYRAGGANSKAVVVISSITGGLNRPGVELREIAADDGAGPFGKPGMN